MIIKQNKNIGPFISQNYISSTDKDQFPKL